MALVTITAAHDTEGGTGPAAGSLTFTATRRRNGPAASLILPASVTAVLTGGTDTVDLAATTAGWAWKVVEAFTGQPTRILHVTVPEVGEIAYTDLPRVSRASLEPLEEADPAWWAMADSTLTGGAVVGDELLLTRTDGGTVNAGNVRGPQGIQGVQGIQGERGIQGIQGEVGPIGLTGPQGIQGERGLTGLTGPQGIQGVQGNKGDPGGITLGTVLLTADLNTIVTSGVYRQDNGPNATLARNYPRANTGGVMLVLERVSPGASASVMQEYIPAVDSLAGTAMTYRRYSTTNNTAWTPWRTFASSRVDQTAGRAIYGWDELNGREQLIYGDTGWRQMALDPLTYSSDNGVQLRRVGNTISLRIIDTTFTTGASTTPTFYLPAGFRVQYTSNPQLQYANNELNPPSYHARLLPSYDGTFPHGVLIMRATRQNLTTSARLQGEISWQSFEAWPTSLPGAAAGTIPNL